MRGAILEKEQKGHISGRPLLTLTDLNQDVLSVILSYLSTSDALKLSTTTRSMHYIAKRRALSVMEMHSSRQLRTISKYLLGDISGRLHHLRHLVVRAVFQHRDGSTVSVSVRSLEAECAHLLKTILQRAVNLTSLDMHELDTILQINPGVGPAIASLPRLKTLEIRDVERPRSLDFLHILSSRPRKLTLHLLRLYFRSRQVLPIIASLQSIQSLQIIGDEEIPHLIKPQSGNSWPNIQELSLSSCSLSLSMAAQAFPNLKVLRLSKFNCKPSCSGEPSWPSLYYLVTRAKVFEEWKITCHVRHLSLTAVLALPRLAIGGRFTRSGDLVPTLRAVANISPVALDFNIMLEPSLSETFYKDLARAAPHLRSLEVELCTFNYMPDLRSMLRLWVEEVAPILASLPQLGHIGIVINSSLTFNCSASRQPRFAIDPRSDTAYQLALRLAQVIPSLDSILMGYGCKSPFAGREFKSLCRDFWWWEVKNAGSERSLHAISSRKGEGMRERQIAPE